MSHLYIANGVYWLGEGVSASLVDSGHVTYIYLYSEY